MKTKLVIVAVVAWVALLGTCLAVLWSPSQELKRITTATLTTCVPANTVDECAVALNVPESRRQDPEVRQVLATIMERLGRVEEAWGPFSSFSMTGWCISNERAEVYGTASYTKDEAELVVLFHRMEGAWVVLRYGAPGEFERVCER